MTDLIVKRFETPDERKEFALGYYELITVGALTMGREVLEPGWKWSTHVGPLVGTEHCEVRHVGYQLSGSWICEARDGSQVEIGPGDAFDVEAGHDSWVVGDERSVTIDFQGSDYAPAPGSGERVLATLVFTDVVGSTPLAARLGDAAWKRAFGTHLEDLHVLLGVHRGLLVDTAGDGTLARFGSPADALRWALAVVAATRRHGFEVRVGAHTAEVELTDGDVRGVGVHLAARVMGTAGAGQVLVTGTTRELVAGAAFGFSEAETYELKGIDGARTLYSVTVTV